MIDALMEFETVKWILGVGAICTALAVIYKVIVQPVAKGLTYMSRTYEHVMDYDERLKRVERNTSELQTNSGSSLKDAVNRIEYKQAGQTRILNQHLEWAQDELLKVWQNMASRDAVEAATRTAEMLAEKEAKRGDE